MFKHDEVSVPELSTKNINRKRFYQTQRGKLYPSITTVLQKRKMDPVLWSGEKMLVMKLQTMQGHPHYRGTKVHHMCEDFLNNMESDYPEKWVRT